VGVPYPFSALVGQDEMRTALKIVAVDPGVGGVLILGHRGTGKSTAVRALPALLPPMEVVEGCRYGCHPEGIGGECEACRERNGTSTRTAPVPVVDLPLGATEDRVVGTLDLERALTEGVRAFEPGLLARAHRGFLYVDEVNLLEDHLVDLLLDVAASGENVVEREGISIRHPARFVLVGSGNPEEGELRPQLLDRFGLSVEVTTPTDLEERVEVLRRRDAFDRDPDAYARRWRSQDGRLRAAIGRAREALEEVRVPDEILGRASELCLALGTDGLRGELTLLRAARVLAALEAGSGAPPPVGVEHLRQVAPLSLRHRLRRDPLDETGSTARVQRAVEEVLPA
jgi:magnesium chelatase subunit I